MSRRERAWGVVVSLMDHTRSRLAVDVAATVNE
jgi:hypothetical protein